MRASAAREAMRIVVLVLAFLVALAACAPSNNGPARTGQDASESQRPSGSKKVLNMGISTIVDAFSIAGSSTTGGGGLGYIEIHSQALFTSDKTSGRPVPRLLSELPTLENGGLRLTDS